MMATKRAFSDWNKEELEGTFGLIRHRTLPALDEWFAASETQPVDALEQEMLHRLQELLIDHADAWNETELTEYFIGPMLALVNFNTPLFTIFAARPLAGIVGDYELYGAPDAMIATGHYSPKIPYFCFHESKKEDEPKGDPAAQALSAMLVARELNHRAHPLYGVYVVGKLWHFMLLQQDDYCISKSFAADDEEIFEIFKILKALKAILIELVQQDVPRTG